VILQEFLVVEDRFARALLKGSQILLKQQGAPTSTPKALVSPCHGVEIVGPHHVSTERPGESD
jgi:hypothetical protein